MSAVFVPGRPLWNSAACSLLVKTTTTTTLLSNSRFSTWTGLTVVIRCPDSNNTNSTTGGMALPKFAIRGMLKTFGLHGVVLDVDSVSAAPHSHDDDDDDVVSLILLP